MEILYFAIKIFLNVFAKKKFWTWNTHTHPIGFLISPICAAADTRLGLQTNLKLVFGRLRRDTGHTSPWPAWNAPLAGSSRTAGTCSWSIVRWISRMYRVGQKRHWYGHNSSKIHQKVEKLVGCGFRFQLICYRIGTKSVKISAEMAKKNELEVATSLWKWNKSNSVNFYPFLEGGCQLQVLFLAISPQILKILVPIMQHLLWIFWNPPPMMDFRGSLFFLVHPVST